MTPLKNDVVANQIKIKQDETTSPQNNV